MRTSSSLGALLLTAVLALPVAAQQSAPVGVTRAALATAPTLGSAIPGAVENAPGIPSAEGNFGESGFSQFMASPAGRIVRVVAGAAMIGGGIAMNSGAGTALAVVGAVPLSAGVLDLCYISGLLGGPWKGSEIRALGKGK